MTIVEVTAPAMEPVSLGDTKNHLRVDIDDDDQYIQSLIVVARRSCEHIANYKFVQQTWNLVMDGWPGSNVLELPKTLSPLASVTHIKYYDEAGDPFTFDAANYIVDPYSIPARIVLQPGETWPADILRIVNGVEVQVVVGFGDDPDVPMEIKQAMLLAVGHYYENREDVVIGTIITKLPRGIKDLLWFDRNVPL